MELCAGEVPAGSSYMYTHVLAALRALMLLKAEPYAEPVPRCCQTLCACTVSADGAGMYTVPMPCCRAQQNAAQLQLQDKLLLLRCQKHVEEAMAAAEQAAADQVRTSGELYCFCISFLCSLRSRPQTRLEQVSWTPLINDSCCMTAACCKWGPCRSYLPCGGLRVASAGRHKCVPYAAV